MDYYSKYNTHIRIASGWETDTYLTIQTALLAFRESFKSYKGSWLSKDSTGNQWRSERRYGTWTCLAGVVRLLAASRLSIPELYLLALCTYCIAALHFVIEWKVFNVQEPGHKWAVTVAMGTIAVMIASSTIGLGARSV